MAITEYKLGQEFSAAYDDIENCKIITPGYRQGVSQDIFFLEKRNPLVVSKPVTITGGTNVTILNFKSIGSDLYYLVSYLDTADSTKKVCLCKDTGTVIEPIAGASNPSLFNPLTTCRRLFKFTTVTGTLTSSGTLTSIITSGTYLGLSKYKVINTAETFQTKAVKDKYIYFTDAKGSGLYAKILDYVSGSEQTQIWIDLDVSTALLEPQIGVGANYYIGTTLTEGLYWGTQTGIRTFHPGSSGLGVLTYGRITSDVLDMIQLKGKTIILYELSSRMTLEVSCINTNGILVFGNQASVMHKQLYSQYGELADTFELAKIEDYLVVGGKYGFLLGLLTIKTGNTDAAKGTVTYDEHQIKMKTLNSSLGLLQKGCMTDFKNGGYVITSNKYFYGMSITTSPSGEEYSLELSEQGRFVRGKLDTIDRYCKLFIEDEKIHIFHSKDWGLCDIDTAETFDIQYDFFYKGWMSQVYKKAVTGMYYYQGVAYHMLDGIYSEGASSVANEFSADYYQTIKIIHGENNYFNIKMFNYLKIMLGRSAIANVFEGAYQYHINGSIYEIEGGLTSAHFINNITSADTKGSSLYGDLIYSGELAYDPADATSGGAGVLNYVMKPIGRPGNILKIILSSKSRFIYGGVLISDTIINPSVFEPALLI